MRFLLLAVFATVVAIQDVPRHLPPTLEAKNCNPSRSKDRAPIIVSARSFLWEHWHNQKPAYLTLTGSSVDATSTPHIFVEQEEAGRWRVAWRIVRHNGVIDDLPTYFAVEWVRPNGCGKPELPLRRSEEPDPKKHELEFRDKCGDVEQFV